MKDNAIGCIILFVFLAIIALGIHTCDTMTMNNNESKTYKKAIKERTSTSYQDYLKRYPKGKHHDEIKSLHDEECWREASSSEKYEWYMHECPQGKYRDKAKEYIKHLWGTDERAWNRAQKTGDYENYLALYLNGVYARTAEKKIVDNEVHRIMLGNYSSLPTMQKTSNDYTDELNTQIFISNNTSYNLTVYYSGADSKRVKLPPNGSASMTLMNGNYRVAASVDASNVRKYAGQENLSGGSYRSSYSITTSRL